MPNPSGSLGTPNSAPGSLSPGAITSSGGAGPPPPPPPGSPRNGVAFIALRVSPPGQPVSQLGTAASQLGRTFGLGIVPPITLRQGRSYIALLDSQARGRTTLPAPLGRGVFGLGAPPVLASQAPGRLASASIVLKWLTPGRVTEVTVDVALVPSSDIRTTDLAVDVAFVPSSDVRTTETYVEVAGVPSPPPANVTEVQIEAALVSAPPPARATSVFVDVLVVAWPTRIGNASITLAYKWVRQAQAWVNLATAGEKELQAPKAYFRLAWPGVAGGAPLPDPTVPPTLTIVHGPGNTLPAGTYTVGYTWTDPYGQTHVSPTSTVTLIDVAGIQVVTPTLPPGATGVHVYISDPGGSLLHDTGATNALVQQTPETVIVTERPPLWALPIPDLNTTGYTEDKLDHDFREDDDNSRGTKGWRIAEKAATIVVRSGEQDIGVLPAQPGKITNVVVFSRNPSYSDPLPADDVANRHWYEIGYVPIMEDHTVTPRIEGWRNPLGGFHHTGPFQDQTHGMAFYNPNWRALPTAPALTDPAIFPETDPLPTKSGTHTYYRHVWHAAAGDIPAPGLLTMRVSGVLDHVYLNGTELLTGTAPHYWWTWEIEVPPALLRAGTNVLAFECHTLTESDVGSGDAGIHQLHFRIFKDTGGGAVTHVNTGGNWDSNPADLQFAALPNGSLLARRPDGTTRAFWQTATFKALGRGYLSGGANPGFLSWFQANDDGPGFWGYMGNTHNPQYWMNARWEDAGVSPDGERQVMWGHGWPWPPPDLGFTDGYEFVQSTDGGVAEQPITFAIGDTRYRVSADRWSMISVGKIGGGGNAQLENVALGSSLEYAPGASYMLTYPLKGSGTIERTVFSDMVHVNADYPVEAEPWGEGRVVAVVNVNDPEEIIISVSSKNPTLGQLGKARMWVYWLDENGVVGGTLASDNEFLHATFGTQPATLWPYSENMFWTSTYFGTGAWKTAKAIQIVMFRHHDTPSQYNQWLVNVTVREKVSVMVRRKFAQWV